MSSPSVGLNYLSRNRGKLIIPTMPDVTFNLRDAEIPGIDLPSAVTPDPFRDKPLHGDKVEFEPLNATFLVDENLNNWLEAFDWIIGLGAPKDKDQFLNKANADIDIELIVYSSHNNPILRVTFIGCVPVALTGVFFSEGTQETEFVEATLTIEYLRYDVERIV